MIRETPVPVQSVIANWHSSLRTQISLWFGILFLLAICFMILITMWGIPFTPIEGRVHRQRQEIYNQLNLAANRQKQHILSWLKEKQQDIHMLSHDPDLVNNITQLVNSNQQLKKTLLTSNHHIQNHIQMLLDNYPEVTCVRIVKPRSGTILLTTTPDKALDKTLDNFSPDFLLSTQYSDQGYISRVYLYGHHKEPTFNIGMPVLDHRGAVQALLVTTINFNAMIGSLLPMGESQETNRESLLVNESSHTITTLKHALMDGTRAEPLTHKIEAKPAMLAAQGGEGLIETLDYRGEFVIAAFRHIRVNTEWGWGLVVKMDRAALFAPIKTEILEVMRAGLFCFLLVMLLTTIMANKLTTSLQHLSRIAKEFGEGDLAVRSTVPGNNEISLLALTFNRMADNIKNAIQNLKQVEEEIRNGEMLMRLILESTRDGILVIDNQGKVTHFNSRFKKLWQIPETVLTTREDKILLQAVCNQLDDPQAFLEKVEYLYQSDKVAVDTIRFKDGRIFERYSSPLQGDFAARGRIWSFTDITTRKQAEDSLQLSDKILSNMEEGVVLVRTSDNSIVYVNPKFQRMFAYDSGELIGKNINIVNAPTGLHQEDTTQSILNVLNRTGLWSGIIQNKRKDGSYFWCNTTVSMFDHQQYGTVWVSIHEDITVRKAVERALLAEQTLTRSSIDALHDTYFLFNPITGKAKRWNQKFREISGYHDAEIAAMKAPDSYYSPEDLTKAAQASKNLAKYGTATAEMSLISKNGDQTPFEYSVSLVHTPQESLAISIGRDISKRKQMEKDLRQAKESAEFANKAKSSFLAAMSHEIRTPMNAILGMGEILAESHLDEHQKQYVEIINHAGEGLLALINDILDLSKIESGQLELEMIPINPSSLAKYSINIIQQRALNKGIALTIDIHQAIPSCIIGDPQRLQQILLNLLSNAIKFTDQGHIALSLVKTAENVLRFSVSDTGIGIPKNKHTTIFQPFKQVDSSTTRRFGGTGLGLSICDKLIDKMGGKIWVVSLEGQGSTFHVDIPFTEIPSDVNKPLCSDSKHSATTNKYHGGLSILLADDTEENSLVIKAFLKKSKHHLTIVENGLQAVEKFKINKFDIVLMDLHMPVMDGYEATRKIRAWENQHMLAPTPILALTADAMKEDIEKTRRIGCNLHLTKPIRKAYLLDTLDNFAK